MKNPADFIGNALGQSESNTKAILATTIGKVLIIDEAYMLYSGSGGSGIGNHSDSFKTAVIDTIVAEVQSVPGEDRCVLLLGYKDQMTEMFDNVNPGLARRFALEDGFHFQDFDTSQLREILELKLKHQELGATEEAKSVADEVLGRARRRPNFGNAGEVENLLSKAKARYQLRQSSLPIADRPIDILFEPQDFDADFGRSSHAVTNCKKLFEDVVGSQEVVAKLEGYQQIAANMKARSLDPYEHIPTNFIFKGPPGTGKTTTARKMGKVYYDMGFLSSAEVIECSASDLVGQYVGQTGPKTQKQLEKALGKVLFIDEAYRLGEGHFATEAINELVDCLTKPKFHHKLIVILAGYNDDMNRLMAVNSGLSSRFPEEIIFQNMSVQHSMQLLDRQMVRNTIDLPALRNLESKSYRDMSRLIHQLSLLPSFGNARDILELAKTMVKFVFKKVGDKDTPLSLSPEEAISCIKTMLSEKQSRYASLSNRKDTPSLNSMVQAAESLPQGPPPPAETNTTIAQKEQEPPAKDANNDNDNLSLESPTATEDVTPRDLGVTDETWAQLQSDIAASSQRAHSATFALATLTRTLQEHTAQEALLAQELLEVQAHSNHLTAAAQAQAQARNDNELKKKREALRLQEQAARVARAKVEE